MKKSLSFLVALALVFGLFASMAAAADSDLTTAQKYQQLVDSKVLKGTTDGDAHLSDNLTRAEFATIAVAIAGLQEDTTSTPAFADIKAGQWWTGAIQAAYNAGLVNGVGNGNFSPKADVTVQEIIKVAVGIAKLTPVADATVEGAADWAAPYIKAAQDAGLPLPTNYKDAATRGQTVDIAFAVLKANAAPKLSDVVATVNTDNTVTVTGKVTSDADSVKVTVGTNDAAVATLKDDGTFTYTSKALAVGNYDIAVVAYHGSAASAPTTVTAKIEVFGVVSVQGLNATQVSVVFSNAVDSDDGKVTTHYSIAGQNPTSVDLSDDGKTATLTFSSNTQVEVTDAVVVVDPVKLSGNSDVTSAKYSSIFTYEDKTAPEITSVEAKTKSAIAQTLSVNVSEPVDSVLVKIDGAYYAASGLPGSSFTVTGLNLEASKSHTVEFINLTDKGGNKTVTTTKTFSVTVDTSAPVATLSTSSDKTIVITFNKDMNETSVQNAFLANMGVKDEAYADVLHAAATKVNSKEFKIEINPSVKLFSNATSRTLTLVFPSTIQDSLGNALAATTQSVTLTKDTVKPASTDYKVVKNSDGKVTQVIVNFSEGLVANANPAEPMIVDMNGVNVTGTLLGGLSAQPIVAGDKSVTYNAAVPATLSGSYAFSFGANLVTDQSESALGNDAFNLTIEFGSSSTSNFDLTGATGSANVLTVDFGRQVKGGAVANSATDPANYTVAGKPLPAGTIITLNPAAGGVLAQSKAIITLPGESIDKTDATAIITVANVMSLNSELLNAYTGTVAVVDNTKPVLNSAVLNGDGSITLAFSEGLAVAPSAASDIALTVNGLSVTAGYNITPISSGADAGKYLLTVTTLPAGVTGSLANASAYSVKVATTSSPVVGKDVAGNVIKGGTEIAVK